MYLGMDLSLQPKSSRKLRHNLVKSPSTHLLVHLENLTDNQLPSFR